MATWDETRTEIAVESESKGVPQHDPIRRSRISAVERISQIPLVVYAADFTNAGRAGQNGPGIQIHADDKTGFLQALSDVPDGPLDVLLHSPGGSPTATESIVHLLRSRFDPVRFIIPHTAKSAATMLALSGNEILLGEDAELGPIDPQVQFVTEQRPVTVPARAALDQFERAASDIDAEPGKLRVWLPILRQYGPAFLQECQNAIELSETLATTWLEKYMFEGEDNPREPAGKIATWLANHNNFMTHARPVWIEQLLDVEPTMRIQRLRDVSEEFEAAVMAVYWAIDVTFAETHAIKLVEHQEGSAYIQLLQPRLVQSAPIQPVPQPQAQPTPPQNREQRRLQNKGRGGRVS